jgi:hypothetical protein
MSSPRACEAIRYRPRAIRRPERSGAATRCVSSCAATTTGPGCCSSPRRRVCPSPRSRDLPSGSRRSGSSSFDAIVERRLTHSPDPVLARDASNLALISGPSRLRPDLEVAEGQPIAAALAAMTGFDGVSRVEPATPFIGLPSLA